MAAAAATARRNVILEQFADQMRRAQRQHDYEEAVRRAELGALNRRIERLERRREECQPMWRDGITGFLLVAAPAAMWLRSPSLGGGERAAAMALTGVVGLVVGDQWMAYRLERRLQQLDDEIDRLGVRAAVKGVPAPRPE